VKEWENSMSGKHTMDRRAFLTTAALGGAAILGESVFSGPLTAMAATGTWDQTADVVIVGGGGTGLAAAAQATILGATVIVLEKASTTGGSTALSGGVIQAAGTTYQKQYTKYKNDTPQKHYETWLIESEGLADKALIKDMTAKMPGHIDWLTSLGLKYNAVYGHNHVPYLDKAGVFADRIHVYEGGGASGGGLPQINALSKKAKDGGASIQVSTEVTKLITDGTNGVVGVEAKGPNGVFTIKANRGVIIATSGIDHSRDLTKALSAQAYWDLTQEMVFTAPSVTGDGIRMGMEIGAGLAGFGGCIDFDPITAIGTDDRNPQIACLYVNGQGKRFVCEDATYAYVYRAIFAQTQMHRANTHMVLDANGVQGPGSPWRGSKLAAAVSSGQLIQGSSIGDLAKKIGVPAANLTATMAEWNSNIAKYGKDPVFQRNTWLVPIAKGPFYAYKPISGNLGAIGGLKIDVDARVLDLHGKPIPHLFAGGMAAGGWIGPYYPGSGTAIAGTVHWGRTAGASAANETPVA
jgi:urocanate reductase